MSSSRRGTKEKFRTTTKHWGNVSRLWIAGLLTLLLCAWMTVSAEQNSSNKHKISVQAKLSHDGVKPGSACFVLLSVDIRDGWHINSANPTDENLVETSIEIQKKEIIGNVTIQYPPAEERKFDFSEDMVEVYEGTIRIFIRMEIRKSARPGTYIIPATVNYQACSNTICLAPTSVNVNIPMRVTNDGRTIREINKELFEPYTLK